MACAVPEEKWLRILWELVGTESLLYSLIKIAGAKEVLQYDSDATRGGRSVRRIWTRLRTSTVRSTDRQTGPEQYGTVLHRTAP